MRIELKKFGSILVSRPNGREAILAFQPILKNVRNDEIIEVDFDEVVALGPSWADEFLIPLMEKYKDRVILLNTNNPSVKATLEILEK